MSISGGIKFLKKSVSDIDVESVYIIASSGTNLKSRIIDRVPYTKWESLGSDDSTVETLEINFGSAQTIDRLILRKNNFKDFTVQYDNSGWTHFANVVTKEGTQTNITETANTKETNYYEFDSVSTEKILITINTTQTVDAEKFLHDIVLSEELGTFAGYPVYNQNFVQTKIKKEGVRGKSKFSLLDEVYGCSLEFRNYPVEADHQIVLDLINGLKEFYIYPCGANEDQFRFEQKGFRLEDIYLVYIESDFNPNYTENVYQLGLNYSLELSEVL